MGGYGIFRNGIKEHDWYCGISQDICPEFECTTVEDLKGKQCAGLTQRHSIPSAKDCRALCCQEADCSIWLWVKSALDVTGITKVARHECWTGQSEMCKEWETGADECLQGERIK